MLIQNVPVLVVGFIVLIMCLFIYCVHFFLFSGSFHTHQNVCLIDIFVFWAFSISAALILPCIIPVVLVYPLLGLFICVVDLSSMRFKCFKFICVVAFLSLLITKY